MTHSTPFLSINSNDEGVCPAINIRDTASQAASFVFKEASIRMFSTGLGISLTTIFVTMPSVPSEPIIHCVKVYPEENFNVLAPVQVTSPEGSTTSTFNTYSRMIPYFTTWGPPLPCATLPPIKQEPLLAGSTG